MKLRFSAIAHVVCAGALIGCAVPKAQPADGPAKDPPKQEPKPTTENPAVPDDGFRVGSLIELPKDTEFRATNPKSAPGTTGGSGVIVTPPTAPTHKPKPAPVAE